jgi:hypothetical protein
MKKIILISFLFISLKGFTQKCGDYYYMQNNKTIELAISNRKGKESGRMIYHITNVTRSGSSMTSTVTTEMHDKKGGIIAKGTNHIRCTGGVLMMDMKMFMPGPQQQQAGNFSGNANDVYLEYPSNMKEGDVLKDGHFSMDFTSASGMNGHMNIDITNRRVNAKESVTTPAGTWNCFKITYHTKMLMKMGIGIPMNSDITEWYAPGFGVVKSESNGGGTEIVSIK